MSRTVFMKTVTGHAARLAAQQEGYDALNEATGHDYDFSSPFEYFATRTDGGQEWRAYHHVGPQIFVAKVIEMPEDGDA